MKAENLSFKPVFAIIGPTASGKTALSIKLAKKFDAEIVSCDSRQIYKYMDIGTAKPSPDELSQVRHRAIDIITPDQAFSYADFAETAEREIEDIFSLGKIPFIVGGTGFYLDGLVNGVSDIPEIPETRMKLMRGELEMMDSARLLSMLQKLDPVSAARIKFNDRQRLARAIMVSEYTGKPFSSYRELKKKSDKYKYFIFGLTKTRELLYNNINQRVDEMFGKGLLKEVEHLLKSGYNDLTPGMKTIGYQECVQHISGAIPLEKAVDLVKQHTRNYAKRQETYFKKFNVIKWNTRNNSAAGDGNILDCLCFEFENILKEVR